MIILNSIRAFLGRDTLTKVETDPYQELLDRTRQRQIQALGMLRSSGKALLSAPDGKCKELNLYRSNKS